MSKVKVHYLTKTKEYYQKTKYHTKIMILDELPKSGFHEHYNPIDIDKLLKICKEWVDKNNLNTFNKIINFQILEGC